MSANTVAIQNPGDKSLLEPMVGTLPTKNGSMELMVSSVWMRVSVGVWVKKGRQSREQGAGAGKGGGTESGGKGGRESESKGMGGWESSQGSREREVGAARGRGGVGVGWAEIVSEGGGDQE